MEFTELTQSRRTIHQYKPEPVDPKWVEEALRLSLWAPNHRTTWPWLYFWTGPETRQLLAELAVELKSKGEPMSDVKKSAILASVLTPAHLIVLGIGRAEPKQLHEDYATLSCSVQIATTFLWQKGVGTKWSTGGYSLHSRTYEILGVSPAEVQIEGALLIGVPDGIPRAPVRPDLDMHLRRTR